VSGGSGVTTLASTSAAALQTGIEKSGVSYGGKHVTVASAICAGEAQYGAKWVGYELEYHRFSCSLFDREYRLYEAQVVITKSNSKYFWWSVISIKAG
jgi:hypothetical protein